jgi:glycosyltransferase A (GT-A) superfamily protein (DUF2064 family)
MTDRTIVVMARPLVRGAVKTRLARALGDDAALAVYERLLRGTLDAAEQVPGAALVLAEAPAAAAPDSDPLSGRDGRWSRLRQRGEGLGERLAGVFADLFAAGAQTVVAVNSDSPALPPDYLAQAFDELVGNDLVVGPASDGGYYLIGAGRQAWAAGAGPLRPLLAASPMSSPSCSPSRCTRRGPPVCSSRSSRCGSTSMNRPISACSTGSRAGRPCAASRSTGCARSTSTSRTAALAPAGTATTAPPRSKTS